MEAWRIAREAHAALDGEGARLYGSRWTPRGMPAIFASATLSLAALERFVHTDPDLEPTDLVALEVTIAHGMAVEAVSLPDLPKNWRDYPAPPALASIGERWQTAGKAAVLSVPSVVIPRERNFILNPAHPDFGKITVAPPDAFSFDPRMWKTKR